MSSGSNVLKHDVWGESVKGMIRGVKNKQGEVDPKWGDQRHADMRSRFLDMNIACDPNLSSSR